MGLAKHVLLPLLLVLAFVGYGAYEVLGSGTPGSGTPTPEVSFESEPAGAVMAAGVGHGVAVAADGTVWAWGENEYGQLGDGTATNRSTPVQV